MVLFTLAAGEDLVVAAGVLPRGARAGARDLRRRAAIDHRHQDDGSPESPESSESNRLELGLEEARTKAAAATTRPETMNTQAPAISPSLESGMPARATRITP